MKPQPVLRLSRSARHTSLIAIVPLALLLVALPKAIPAQQSVQQEPQYAPGQNPQTPKPKPPAGHYAPSPQPGAVQQPDQSSNPAIAPDQVPHPRHAQQHHPVPTLDRPPDPTYAQQTAPVPASNRAPHAGSTQQLHLAPAPEQAPDPDYIPHPYVALNQAPDPGFAQNPSYAQQTYPAPNQAPDSGYAQQPYAAADQAPVPGYAQDPGYTQNPGYSQSYAQPGPQPSYAAQQPQESGQQVMSPDQLEQLLAPIALYPDALVAQVLAAATYPAQVVGADHWLQSQGYASPDSIAYAANLQDWDPSVKALTAFPQVLAQMDHDIGWTTDLGNAYYNQPQDVMQTIQVLRQRAFSAGTLQNTPQEAVTDNQGYLQLAPVNPQVVYVPAYNPWNAYGQPIQPYSNFSLLGSLASFAGSAALRFGPGIAVGAFNHTPFGWATWALNWLTQSVLFHQSSYMTHSTTVARWNSPRGGGPLRGSTPRPMDAYSRGGNFARPAEGYRPDNRPSPAYRGNELPNRGYRQPGNYARPAQPAYAYNRPQSSIPARPQTYARPGGDGSSSYGSSNSGYGRPATEFARQQALREPTPQFRSAPQSNSFSQRSYSQPNRTYSQPPSEPRSYAPARTFAQAQPERSGGSGFFGGRDSGRSHESYREPKAPKYKAPKAPKEHGGHSSGGSHHFGGHRL